MLDLKGKTPAWDGDEMLDRIIKCKSMLYIHGFITDSERGKINRRINKWVNEAIRKTKQAGGQ